LTNLIKKSTFSGGGCGKNGNFNTVYQGIGIFLKECLKCTKIYIVGSGKRLFLKNNRFYVENHCQKTSFSVLKTGHPKK